MQKYLFSSLSLLFFTLTSAAEPGFLHVESNRDAFARPAPALDSAQLRIFNFGNRIFNTNWVVAPASSVGFDGLGPTFNRVSCSACHLRDGRGRPPIDGEDTLQSMLVRISLPAPKNARHIEMPVPGYGLQINDRAIPGVAPEAKIQILWTELPGRYGDGTPYSLRQPKIVFSDLAYGALPKSIQTSARVATPVFGMGLFDALDEQTILANADPNDRNRDGISGRVNRVYSTSKKSSAIGRFGWKANVATLHEQNLSAALGDIGISSSLFPQQNCAPEQSACNSAISGGEPELSDAFAEKLTQYVEMLGVPKARALDAQALRGKALFAQYQCQSCHLPTLTTRKRSKLKYLQNQSFSAYTDLLLHDMGTGLADGRTDFDASAKEWRTAPLWGLGLLQTVNEHQFLLHDGRARGVAEAILWHDGEAKAAKEHFRKAKLADRDALLAFLNTL
jgi:CxxC motif-containing protein (DUF1111 family)